MRCRLSLSRVATGDDHRTLTPPPPVPIPTPSLHGCGLSLSYIPVGLPNIRQTSRGSTTGMRTPRSANIGRIQ
ncbi:hypothetical protein PISMIDRAFT_671798 [Pisolithus microcarpus 441]|uniref:Uncharacterized protein n=1 Tax=Pisolithus microcarpus 441 TaxID=765257 RepID=A0A0C9ZUY8_9AGAM|nr:hypothetical protein PISMIDRAFT_671798 [Pisolithus microcarpus 441]